MVKQVGLSKRGALLKTLPKLLNSHCMLSTSGSCELIHENQDRHSQLIHWVTSKVIRATHALSTAHNSPVQRHQFSYPSAISRFINEFRAAQFDSREGVLVFHRLWAQSGTSSAGFVGAVGEEGSTRRRHRTGAGHNRFSPPAILDGFCCCNYQVISLSSSQ